MRWFFLFLALLAGCAKVPMVTFHAVNGDVPVIVEIADSPEEWARGLIFREMLAENSGMLFIFPEEKERVFWMKNTNIPLDMIFMNAGKEIVSVFTAHPCAADPCQTYSSGKPARYVVEVNSGFAARNGLVEGVLMTIHGPAGI